MKILATHHSLANAIFHTYVDTSMEKYYRPNVAAIIQRRDGLVLIAQRSDFPESWQFPQGGIDSHESPVTALQREVFEETSIPPDAYHITAQSGPYHYDFPDGMVSRGFHGQMQFYFVCSLTDDYVVTEFSPATTCGEFIAFRWVPLQGFPVSLAPPMKQDVYRKALHALFGVDNFH